MIVEGEDGDGYPCIGRTGRGDMCSVAPLLQGPDHVVLPRETYVLMVEALEQIAKYDRYRAALSGLLDAADHYCAMYQKHGGSHMHCGTAWTRMYRERVTAREALGDD